IILHQVEGIELCPRSAQQLREVREALDVLQATEVSRVPDRPVLALFPEQPLGGRPGVWCRAGAASSDSVLRLSLLYPHNDLFSFADPLSRQNARPRKPQTKCRPRIRLAALTRTGVVLGEETTWGASRL